MYDLYDNPPINKSDLRNWLVDWIEKVKEKRVFDIHGEMFTQVAGFSRSGYSHEILKNNSTNQYTWLIRDWVSEAHGLKDPYIAFPKERYSDIESVLESMIGFYYTKWNLTG
jgi:hypothetical protein